jgi:hypothetical protein
MIASILNYMFGYNKQPDICNNTNTNTNTNTNNIDKLCKKLPYELKDYILSYDGRIKYKYKNKKGCGIDYHKFVNVIHKHDERYNIITPIIGKKYTIMKDIMTNQFDNSFYFDFALKNHPNFMLCYDYNWSNQNAFVICYTDIYMLEPCFWKRPN